MNNIFDSHCHYDDHWFDDDRQQVLDRVLGEGSAVSFVNHAATDVDSALFGIECAKKYKNFYTSVGFHPEYASALPKDWESRLEELYRLSKATGKLTAIGEIGLDYHYPGYDRDREIEVFEKQLVFAKDKDLPVIVHSRDATQDTMELLKKHGSRGVIHCFSGSAETAKEAVEMGFYIGFTGVLAFKNAKKALRALENVPMDRLLLETDCPYMAPPPYRGQRCESPMIQQVAMVVAEQKGLTPQQVCDMTCENAKRLYGINTQ
ncbi:MAG: TatD family hydrolase [Ruminococcus sp.]|nr:TatD family hydrolase [Ruminococcus sp.]